MAASSGKHTDDSWKGRRLPQRVRIGKPSAESIGDLPRRLVRLIEIETLTERHTRRLERSWRALAANARDDETFSRVWNERARRWRFDDVNALVDEHNEWFPLEARLPWDPAAQDYRAIFGIPWRRERITARWVLDRFPAERAAALSAA